MSNKVTSADNQQGSPRSNMKRLTSDPSETTRRAPVSSKELKAYLLGALHDGTFSSNGRFRISQKGTGWLKYLKEIFTQLEYNSWLYREGKNRDIYVLETLADFLDFKFNPSRLKNNKEKISYVRGFFDAEGGIPKNHRARFYIQLCQSDKKKLVKLKCLLEDVGIKTGKIHNPSYKVDPNYWRMYVLAKSHTHFTKRISSWHPRKISVLRKRMMI